MKKILYLVLLFSSFIFSQNFSLEEYKQFLNNNKDMTPQQLLQMHDAGIFDYNIAQPFYNAEYLDSISLKFSLTNYEKQLINDHGFMVSERMSYNTFGEAYRDVFVKDMPVFVSTDAILHAVHRGYDNILMSIEAEVLIPKLKLILLGLHGETDNLNSKYKDHPEMVQSLKDYDLFFGIAKKLMGENVTFYYPSNVQRGDSLWSYILAKKPVEKIFFADTTQIIDFSQLVPRGHYADPNLFFTYPGLQNYFKTMMWLTRTEFYLIPPGYHANTPAYTSRRSAITTALILKAARNTGAYNLISEFEKIMGFLVGDDDNVTLFNLDELFTELNITDPAMLINDSTFKNFQDVLLTKPFASQKINSQILISDISKPDKLIFPTSFLVMGQKFVIDSYITAQVVYDRIVYQNNKIRRMVPSTLDVLFVLGNDAALQLLKPELEKYKYSSSLASLRYLIDAYDTTFWHQSVFNCWLNSLRSLNPPSSRENLPVFMQTAAWWQQKMNTQLASWTELRHDNLLYAKQSYTGGSLCSFPYSYVEPCPEFFFNIKTYSQKLKEIIESTTFQSNDRKTSLLDFCSLLTGISDTLGSVASKELSNTPLTIDENFFLKSMLRNYHTDYTGQEMFDGWYWNLFTNNGFWQKNFVVADIHTTPTDEMGNEVGWIKHVGTGPINLGTVVVEYPKGITRAYLGAFYSYYDYQTNAFLRLTDQDWEKTYQTLAMRPDFVNLYLANSKGEAKMRGSNLVTALNDKQENILTEKFELAQNYPNPFNNSTVIKFNVPSGMSNEIVSLNIYDIQGQLIKRVVNQAMSSGNYLVQWEGINDNNHAVSSGIYFLKGIIGKYQASVKMILLK